MSRNAVIEHVTLMLLLWLLRRLWGRLLRLLLRLLLLLLLLLLFLTLHEYRRRCVVSWWQGRRVVVRAWGRLRRRVVLWFRRGSWRRLRRCNGRR